MADTLPNVLLVLTDQERYDCTAPDGPPVDTPAMDRLSSEGMRFERAYTPISICTSARASLLTGQFPHGHGMLNNCHEEDAVRANLPPEIPTFSAGLTEAGYDLTYTGKWHVGRDQTPEDFGFAYLGGSDRHHDDIDEAFREYREERGEPLGEVDLTEEIYTRGGEEEGTFVAATTPVDVEATRAYFLAERTIDALEAHANGAGGADSANGAGSAEPTPDAGDGAGRPRGGDVGPFFHRADFYGPHHPYVVPEPYASMYDPTEIEPPDSFAETFAGKPRVQENFLAYRGVTDFDWETWAAVIAKYWGFVSLIDDQVGRLLDALDALDLAEETAVVHAADHGDFVGAHRQFNKGPLMYEDTYRVPLQVRWPGVVEPGSTCERPVHLHDLAPTFLEMGATAVPPEMQAHSLLPLLDGTESTDAGGVAESSEITDTDEVTNIDEIADGGGTTDGSMTDDDTTDGATSDPDTPATARDDGQANAATDEAATARARPDTAYAQYHGDEFGFYTQRAVRSARYTFVYNAPDVNELYDRRNDPAELQNLIDHPDYAAVRREMGRRLIEWMDAVEDPIRRWVPQTLD